MIKKDQRLYVHETYITNGHWLIHRTNYQPMPLPIKLRPLWKMPLGQYHSKSDPEPAPIGGFDPVRYIPKRDGYTPLLHAPIGVKFRESEQFCDEIIAYKFQIEDGGAVIGIDPAYVPILRLGFGFAKSPIDPVLVLKHPDINSDLVAVIMPVRL